MSNQCGRSLGSWDGDNKRTMSDEFMAIGETVITKPPQTFMRPETQYLWIR
jgi:hypothetical protein